MAGGGPLASRPLGGSPLRAVRMGLRGIVLSLYYSGGSGPSYVGPGPLDVLSYRVGVAVEDVGRPALETTLGR